MRLIKRLDTYLLGKYLQLIGAAFIVCLSVLLMQYTWRYLEELIGKGLEVTVILKFFCYASLTLVPMALPLALLLASLITFGNLGETRELLAMKAAGIPLLRILQPIFIFVAMISTGSFFFQNSVLPVAVKELAALVWSMKQKNPELDIPEGQFYSAIPGYNLYVDKKDQETGILYNVMIYTNSGNYEDTQIVLSDSARLQTTADKRNLKLTMFQGERFRNLDAQSGNMMKAQVPYMRETFVHEEVLIPFDANFDLMNSDQFSHNAQTKAIRDISKGIDSLNTRIDSTGRSVYDMQLRSTMARKLDVSSKADSMKIAAKISTTQPFDSAYAGLTDEQRVKVMKRMQTTVVQLQSEYDFRSLISEEDNRALRIHIMEWNKKFTMSVACLIFFFIGAPLGSIIRKGGLGIPVLLSTIIFIFYYIINISGEKMAKSGQWDPIFGVWMSSMVLIPIAAYLTVSSNRDSAVFNASTYLNFLRLLLGISPRRAINPKEVIIVDPDYPALADRLQALSQRCTQYSQRKRLRALPNYYLVFFHYHGDTTLQEINQELEDVVEQLHNTRDNNIIKLLNELPILWPESFARPFRNIKANRIIGVLFPIGLLFWLRMWQFRLRTWRDMTTITQVSGKLIKQIKNKHL